MSSNKFAFNKMVTISVAKDYNFFPVETDLRDNSIAGYNGFFVSRVKCAHCEKTYDWNQLTRIMRHSREHKENQQ